MKRRITGRINAIRILLGSVTIWIASLCIKAQSRRKLNAGGLLTGKDALGGDRFSDALCVVPPWCSIRSGTLLSSRASRSLSIFFFLIESVDQLDERIFHG